jgi:hypothetical protein
VSVAAITLLTIAGAAKIGIRRDGRTAVAILGVVVGGLGSAALYAAASHSMDRNLHGRYLLPLYLTAIILACAPLFRLADGNRRWASVVGTALIAWHACALAAALGRYF